MLVHGYVVALLHHFDPVEPSRLCLLSLRSCKQKAVIGVRLHLKMQHNAIMLHKNKTHHTTLLSFSTEFL